MTYALTISGTSHSTAKGSISISTAVEARSTAAMSIPDDNHDYVFRRGQPIELTIDSVLAFAGIIDTPSKVLIAPDGSIQHSIVGADWHYLADKRLVAASYLNQTCGYIVNDLLTNYLAAEGVTVGEIQDGPVIVEAIISYVTVAAALDGLKQKAGFTWWISPDKKLYFIDRATYSAPWAVTRTDIIKGSAKWSGGNPLYRNTQYIRGGKGETSLQTETRLGDSKLTAFTMGYPLAKVPVILTYRESSLLSNGSFETGNPPTGWTKDLGASFDQDATEYKIGSHSAKLVRSGGVDCLVSQSYAGWAGLVGQTVTVGVWIKCTVADSANIQVEDGVVYHNSTNPPADSAWHFTQASLTLNGSSVHLVVRLCISNNNTIAYFDGAMLVVGSTPYSSIGIKGLDTGKDWYWSKGDPILTQDTAGVVLTSADLLIVAYYGQYDLIVKSTDDSQIVAQQVIEGTGTGQVDAITDDSSVSSLDSAYELAAANLADYCCDADQ